MFNANTGLYINASNKLKNATSRRRLRSTKEEREEKRISSASSVARFLHNLPLSKEGHDEAVKLICEYVRGKKARGKDDFDVGRKLAALQVMVPMEFRDCFTEARQICGLEPHQPHFTHHTSLPCAPYPPQRPSGQFSPVTPPRTMAVNDENVSEAGSESPRSVEMPLTPTSSICWQSYYAKLPLPPTPTKKELRSSHIHLMSSKQDSGIDDGFEALSFPLHKFPTPPPRSSMRAPHHPSASTPNLLASTHNQRKRTWTKPSPFMREDLFSPRDTPATGIDFALLLPPRFELEDAGEDSWECEDDCKTITPPSSQASSRWSGLWDAPAGHFSIQSVLVGDSAADLVKDAYLANGLYAMLRA